MHSRSARLKRAVYEEIKACKTCGTGCGYDRHRIWASTTTTVPAEEKAEKKAEEDKKAAERKEAEAKAAAEKAAEAKAKAEEEATKAAEKGE